MICLFIFGCSFQKVRGKVAASLFRTLCCLLSGGPLNLQGEHPKYTHLRHAG